MENNEGHFKLKKCIDLNEVAKGEDQTIGEADLTFKHENKIFQYEYKKPDSPKKEPVKPGIYNFINTPMGAQVVKIELRARKLLTSVVNTKRILREANTFFSKLHIYEELERPKKRGVLLYSAPGCGKTSAISQFCLDMVEKDPGTVIINWPTDQVKSADVSDFLSTDTEFNTDCTKFVLIIEDIGGGEQERDPNRAVSSSLLNLLDGVNVVFKLPTFIVATTNHPENLLGALANRPGRFDLMLELKPPSADERVELLKFIAKRDLAEDEIEAIKSDIAKDFSIAHLEELIVRSRLHDKTIPRVIKELASHASKFKKGFEEDTKKMGFGSTKVSAVDDIMEMFDYEDD